MRTIYNRPKHQRGVAVIMALLLTTLAITIVASLFWQQQVQVRLIENQRLQLQKQWILRGALDWASLILREDAKYSSVDSLDEPWAAPLAETRLNQYVENGKADGDVADTTLSGSISDAQARFNLNNLVRNGVIDPLSVNIFTKLLTSLNLNTRYASATASLISMATPMNYTPPPLLATPNKGAQAIISTSLARTTANTTATPALTTLPARIPSTTDTHASMPYTQVDDLLMVPGMTAKEVSILKPYVIFLPSRTPINANTASAEVIAAVIPGLTLADAETLIASRKSAHFRDLADLSNRLRGKVFNAADLSVNTSYFLVNGKVHMNRARLDMQSLLERNGSTTKTLWVRDF